MGFESKVNESANRNRERAHEIAGGAVHLNSNQPATLPFRPDRFGARSLSLSFETE